MKKAPFALDHPLEKIEWSLKKETDKVFHKGMFIFLAPVKMPWTNMSLGLQSDAFF